ncbi:hypothetical protein [Vannielia sp. SX4]|uniref:hypothetical protein n=1 Tax=Vannielia sp. SX4 TaxID=3463852 RepID=UPI004059B0D3
MTKKKLSRPDTFAMAVQDWRALLYGDNADVESGARTLEKSPVAAELIANACNPD